VIVLSVLIGLVKKLPDHIYKRFENNFNRETELLKIIRSQVEPQKVDIYIKVFDHFSTMFSELFTKDGVPISPNIKFDKSYVDAITRLFFFASDKTIKQYIELKENAEARTSLTTFNNLLADLIVSMRQDLQTDTKMTAKDFLTLIGMKASKKD
jgi:hypothetical protein